MTAKIFYVREEDRNDWECFHLVNPKVIRAPFDQRGFDHWTFQTDGTSVTLEEKFRSDGVKVDITKPQENSDVIILYKPETNQHWYMSTEKYLELSKTHSAIASGWKGKTLEVSHKEFLENATLYTTPEAFQDFIDSLTFEGTLLDHLAA